MEKVKERVPQKNSSNRIFAEVRSSAKKILFYQLRMKKSGCCSLEYL
jgi:hypothetical protein